MRSDNRSPCNEAHRPRRTPPARKSNGVIEASEAWKEYEANKAHVNANMMRLRALRLAKEFAVPAIKAKRKKRAA